MPITTCDSLETFKAELDHARKQLTLEESEDTWDTISQGILHLTCLCNNGGCDFPSEMVAGVRSLSKPLNGALNSERSRLSGAAVELVTTLATGLGSSFEPLVSCFIPTLLALCGRTNKVFTSRARTCILAIIEHTRLPSLLPYFASLASHKSVLPRLTAAEGMLACLNCFNPPDLEKEIRARVIEDFIKLTARDASADVRKVNKEVFKAYKALMPARVDSFVAPLTPVVKKYLDIQTGLSDSRALSDGGHKQTSRPSSRANNKVMEAGQQLTSSALTKPARSNANGAMHNSQQRSTVCDPPAAVDVRAPRQRHPPQPRNLHIAHAPSSNLPQRCAVLTSAPARQVVSLPPSGFARTRPARSTSSTSGPQRPPPMQIKFNSASDRLKPTGSGAKRIPLPVAPTDGNSISEQASATANTADRISDDPPRSKFPGRNAETIAPRNLVGRKVTEVTRSASSSGKQPVNKSSTMVPAAARRPHRPLAKDERTSSRGAPQRPPAANVQESSHPPVKAERKETLPMLVPLPPSPSIPPTEIPLPPSPNSTPPLLVPDLQDKPVVTPLLESADSGLEREALGAPNTPITNLLSSIQRGFLFTPTSPLSPPQNYLPVSDSLSGEMQATIIVNEFNKAPLVASPFCIPPEDDTIGDGMDRHALRDLN